MGDLNINFLKILLSAMTLTIIVLGSLINWFEPYLPIFVSRAFRYGKFAYNKIPTKIVLLEVPKSWFKHFYVFASLYSLYALYLVINLYWYGVPPSEWFIAFLDFMAGSSRRADCDMNTVIIALLLVTLQSFRRFYETWFISVFSKSNINLLQYLVGYIHYWATITVILSEATGFKSGNLVLQTRLSIIQLFGIIIFSFAWTQQYQCARILANLRKNLDGNITSMDHKIPRGGLFKYISSPHLTLEVLIYLSLYLILFKNQSFKYVFLWVLSNQVETALLSHWWYKKTFANYPKTRKAFIPWVF